MAVSVDELSWNSETDLTENTGSSTQTLSVDNAPDSEYVLVMKETTTNTYSATVKAGDFWMSEQGDKTFDVGSDEDNPHVVGPLESGRFMNSDSTFTLLLSEGAATPSNVKLSLLEIPK